MEIQIYAPTQAQPLTPVRWNYEEVKKWVEDGLEAYKGRVYTESTITDAKKDRATLNKLAEAIDTRRKEMKEMYLQPYTAFEAEAKEIYAMIKAQSAEIDVQVKAFENSKKEQKLEQIKEAYATIAGNLAGVVSYERIHNPKWLNATANVSTVTTEISAIVERISVGLSSIDTLNLEPSMAEQVKGVFLKNFDLAEAIAEKDRIEKQRIALEQYKKAQESPAVNEEQYTPQNNTTAYVETDSEPSKEIEIHTVIFKVEATAEQLNALKQFLNTNHIKYGRP